MYKCYPPLIQYSRDNATTIKLMSFQKFSWLKALFAFKDWSTFSPTLIARIRTSIKIKNIALKFLREPQRFEIFAWIPTISASLNEKCHMYILYENILIIFYIESENHLLKIHLFPKILHHLITPEWWEILKFRIQRRACNFVRNRIIKSNVCYDQMFWFRSMRGYLIQLV